MSQHIPKSPEDFVLESVGEARVLPSVEFACRATALATVALPVVMMAINAFFPGANPVPDVVAIGNTTCCG